jgi:hypothetical protein
MPGRVRRLLRPRTLQDIAPGSVIDRSDAADCEALVAFVNTCRLYADELAIDDVTQRAWSELTEYLESVEGHLAEALQSSGDSDRNFRQSQFDAALRFSAIAFGQERADRLAKDVDPSSAPLAVNG